MAVGGGHGSSASESRPSNDHGEQEVSAQAIVQDIG